MGREGYSEISGANPTEMPGGQITEQPNIWDVPQYEGPQTASITGGGEYEITAPGGYPLSLADEIVQPGEIPASAGASELVQPEQRVEMAEIGNPDAVHTVYPQTGAAGLINRALGSGEPMTETPPDAGWEGAPPYSTAPEATTLWETPGADAPALNGEYVDVPGDEVPTQLHDDGASEQAGDAPSTTESVDDAVATADMAGGAIDEAQEAQPEYTSEVADEAEPLAPTDTPVANAPDEQAEQTMLADETAPETEAVTDGPELTQEAGDVPVAEELAEEPAEGTTQTADITEEAADQAEPTELAQPAADTTEAAEADGAADTVEDIPSEAPDATSEEPEVPADSGEPAEDLAVTEPTEEESAETETAEMPGEPSAEDVPQATEAAEQPDNADEVEAAAEDTEPDMTGDQAQSETDAETDAASGEDYNEETEMPEDAEPTSTASDVQDTSSDQETRDVEEDIAEAGETAEFDDIADGEIVDGEDAADNEAMDTEDAVDAQIVDTEDRADNETVEPEDGEGIVDAELVDDEGEITEGEEAEEVELPLEPTTPTETAEAEAEELVELTEPNDSSPEVADSEGTTVSETPPVDENGQPYEGDNASVLNPVTGKPFETNPDGTPVTLGQVREEAAERSRRTMQEAAAMDQGLGAPGVPTAVPGTTSRPWGNTGPTYHSQNNNRIFVTQQERTSVMTNIGRWLGNKAVQSATFTGKSIGMTLLAGLGGTYGALLDSNTVNKDAVRLVSNIPFTKIGKYSVPFSNGSIGTSVEVLATSAEEAVKRVEGRLHLLSRFRAGIKGH